MSAYFIKFMIKGKQRRQLRLSRKASKYLRYIAVYIGPGLRFDLIVNDATNKWPFGWTQFHRYFEWRWYRPWLRCIERFG